jgi:hypothetical protein
MDGGHWKFWGPLERMAVVVVSEYQECGAACLVADKVEKACLQAGDSMLLMLRLPFLSCRRMGSILGRIVGLATTDIADNYGQLLSSECPVLCSSGKFLKDQCPDKCVGIVPYSGQRLARLNLALGVHLALRHCI